MDDPSKKLSEKEQEIKQCSEYLFQAKKKLKRNPKDTDAEVEVEHLNAELAKLKAEKKEQEIQQCNENLLQAKKKLKRNPKDTDAKVEVEHYNAQLADLKQQRDSWVVEDNPLFLRVADGSVSSSIPTLWMATGSITRARKMGFRGGMYRTAQTYLGFYEKRNGIKLDPFSYQDDGTLMINLLFEQRSDALHFRAAVYENVDTASPEGELAVILSVCLASDAVLDEMILVGDYVRDDDSPPDSPRPLSGVTELLDTSPLFCYQCLEDERYFCGLYKADRAHLIDKPLCEKGKQFEKFHDKENNFLALSKQVHCWFDAHSNVNEKIPFFKLLIKHVSSSPDPAKDFRYRVLLTVEAYNAETARLFFPRLKSDSLVVNDTQAETFVYVLNPEEFCYVYPGRTTRLIHYGISLLQLNKLNLLCITGSTAF